MAWFKRNKKESVMPEEVRDFYASERRDRKGMAWLLAIATLLLTFAIAAALFFGGRWAYRAIFDNNDEPATTQNEQQEESTEQQTNDQNQPSGSDQPGGTSSTNTNQPNNPSAPAGGNTGGTGSTGAPAQTVPNTGPNELIDTGPGDEL
jgi:cytoskeletal protein RodZ